MITKKTPKKKYSLQDKFLIGLLLCFNLLIIGFLLIANVRLYAKTNEAQEQYLDLNQEIRELQRKNNQLKELLTMTEGEAEIEKILREKALYKKPGEEVVVISREQTARQQEKNLETGALSQSASLWDKLIDFFKDLMRW